MAEKPKPTVLVQLDTDPQSSVFDSMVAIDAGVDHLLRHANVTPGAVRELVYGTMFTRGPTDLSHTAIFIGGSDVSAGEAVLDEVQQTFFSSVRVSVMLDSNGANTTAAAAVLAAGRHLALDDSTALVLGGTGPVGRRVARLLARAGAQVRVGSRSGSRAEEVCREVAGLYPDARLVACETSAAEQTATALGGAQLVISAGPPAVTLLPDGALQGAESLVAAIDLNAVPPLGIGEIEVTDKARVHAGVFCYGAVGVGETKMKLHKAAVRRLFEANDLVLNAEQICDIGRKLV